jgi:hypothetical protein
VSGGEGNATVTEVSHKEVFGEQDKNDETSILQRKLEELNNMKESLKSVKDRTKV